MNYWKPSVTVAAVVERDGRFLLVEEETSEGLRLNQPAGHLDPGESLMHAVVREALEETAHHVEPAACVGVYMSRYRSERTDTDVTYMRFAFACRLVAADPERGLDTGIVRALWLDVDEIRSRSDMHRSALVMRTVDDYLAGKRYPLEMIFTHPNCVYTHV